MKTWKIILAVVASPLPMVSPALADLNVATELTCPAEAAPGATISVDLTLINNECRPLEVRVISGIVGNANNTVAGVGIFGPVVADPQILVGAATGMQPSCITNICDDGFFAPCQIDNDCHCFPTAPSTVNVSVVVPPVIPSSVLGTVVMYLLITEWEGGEETEVDSCLVSVSTP